MSLPRTRFQFIDGTRSWIQLADVLAQNHKRPRQIGSWRRGRLPPMIDVICIRVLPQ